MLIADCGLRNADCTISKVDGPIRNPQSEIRISFLPMSVQAIAWSPSGAVHIIDQRALPEAQIERDLESGEGRRANTGDLGSERDLGAAAGGGHGDLGGGSGHVPADRRSRVAARPDRHEGADPL